MEPSPAWKDKLAKAEQFRQRIPSDGTPVSEKTEVYLGYDAKNLYVIFICFDREPQQLRARLSRREDLFDDDFIELMVDTFHDHRRAYAFFANPLGVQADALWTEGPGTNDQNFDMSFDTVWNSSGRLTDRGYVIWMAIPFRSLRFSSSDPQTWGLLLARNIPRKNEQAFWPQYSSRIQGRLNQEGRASGLEKISPGRNFQLIPYGVFSLVQGTRPARSEQSHVYATRGLWTDWAGCESSIERQVRSGCNREPGLQPGRVG
jgi:hypothetical protein